MKEITIDYYTGTATFFVNVEANSNKNTYSGQFKVKCHLSNLEYIKADSMYRELLGDKNPHLVSEYVNQLCYALSQLKYRIMESQDWFKSPKTGIDGSDIDDNILLYIFDMAAEAERQYREGIIERHKKAQEDVKKAVDDGTLTDGNEEEEEDDFLDEE